MTDFKPAWWLPGSQLQTLIPALLRPKRHLQIIKERFELADGDFLDLCWTGIGKGQQPIVLVLHGLNGSIKSRYVNGILHAINKHGWRGLLMHFRGCSNEPNRLARSYHSGETGDLKAVLAELSKREPTTPIFVVGYSLGANVLLKAMGENHDSLPIKAAVAVSVPFELAKTVDHLSKGFSRIYQWRLVSGLKKSHKRKFKVNLPKIHSFREFDDKITGPLHGFKGADDYYEQSSSRQYLAKIQIPTLIVQARNDPFSEETSLPEKHELSNKIIFELTERGGHVGFIAGKYPWQPVYWLDQRIINYFEAMLND